MPEAIPQDEQPAIIAPGSPSHVRRASLKVLSRNIDKVVLGNLQFATWYFSPYPETVIFGSDHHPPKLHPANGDFSNHTHTPKLNNHHAEKPSTSIVPKLHVCPYCFKYTTTPSAYTSHIHVHTQALESEPATWTPVPKTALKVYEHNGYTVWDIDGEQEKLYCQNLSLFAKLFLEQKSVFFDTSGFHYFVLTYSPPTPSSLTTPPPKLRLRKPHRPSTAEPSPNNNPVLIKTQQVLGFFSKENLSWDANNLACILVFPPYQHRNLGQLLMAVSYKLSGWEWEDSIIGGPEKPLSTMGRKAYTRFWSERVARFFMGVTADAEGQRVFANASSNGGGEGKRAGAAAGKKRTNLQRREVMSPKEIGDRTGMLAEDVIAALKEMGLCQPQQQKRIKKVKISDDGGGGASGGATEDENGPTSMIVKRSEVLAWAEANGVDLVGAVKEEGFLGEWALSDPERDGDDSNGDGEGDAGSGSEEEPEIPDSETER